MAARRRTSDLLLEQAVALLERISASSATVTTITHALFDLGSLETFNQIENLEGSFDPLTGHMDMYVPLNLIGAKRGTVISGTGLQGTEDVNVHQHAGPDDE